jgi:hypothetical protein
MLPSNKPLHLTVPPQGHRSIIEMPDACGGPAGERQGVDMERPRNPYYWLSGSFLGAASFCD